MLDIPLLKRITDSVVSLQGEQAWRLMVELLNDETYTLYASSILGMEKVVSLAEVYLEYFATIDTPAGSRPSPFPIHVFAFETTEMKCSGLLYSNGAVAYFRSNDPEKEDIVYVLLDDKCVNLLTTYGSTGNDNS